MQKGFSILKAEDACVDFEGQGMISPFEEVSAPPLPPKIDDRLAKATLQVLETGRLTPLIKEELKCKIQARRHSLGQEEYNVEFKKPKSYSVSFWYIFISLFIFSFGMCPRLAFVKSRGEARLLGSLVLS